MVRDIARNMRIIAQEQPFLDLKEPPEPWKKRTIRAVGGLTEVGFGRGSDLLLMVSSQGLGVLDCLTGELVARGCSEYSDHVDEHELLANGIGPLAGQKVPLAGLAGGGLAASTFDNWLMDIETYEWPEKCVYLKQFDWYEYATTKGVTKVAAESVLRAAGFSPTGQSFVVATSSEVTVYSRQIS